ncbi:MAG: hypothetical protein ACSHWR_04495 [Psychromonas sp.]
MYDSDCILGRVFFGQGGIALATMAELPVKQVRSTQHIIADLTLSWGEVVVDYQSDY